MKLFLHLALYATLLTPTLSAQNLPLNEFIDQHKNEAGFTYAVLSNESFEVASKTGIKQEDWSGLHQVVKNIGMLQILIGDSTANAMPYYMEAKTLVSREDFDELLTVRSDDDHVRIWAKSDGATVSDLVLLVGSHMDFVLVCFSGQLELGDISSLARLFESGKAAQLAQQAHSVSAAFSVSPNPSNGQFMITFPEPAETPAEMSLINANGQVLHTRTLAIGREQSVVLTDIAPGTYWIQVKTGDGKIGVKQLLITKG